MKDVLRTRIAATPLRWLLVAVPILAWALHLVFSAAIVQLTCSDHSWRWTLYAITVVTAVPSAAFALVGAALWRGHDDDHGDDDAQIRFFGSVALLIGIFGVVLIVAEGLLVPFLSSCD